MKPPSLSPHLLANVFIRGGHPVLGLIAVVLVTLFITLPGIVVAVAALLKAIG